MQEGQAIARADALMREQVAKGLGRDGLSARGRGTVLFGGLQA